MHPVIQLTVSFALLIMTARMWPPLVYWLLGFIALLMIIKLVRRSARLLINSVNAGWSRAAMVFLAYTGMWIALAAVADFFFPANISAMSIVLCFAGAYAVVAVIVVATGRIKVN